VGEVIPEPLRHGGSRLRAPELIQESHDYSSFQSGKPVLDNWLRRKAYKADGRSARTFVVADGHRVVGYYSLHTGGIMRETLPTAKARRNLPQSVPVVIIGRLAVDLEYRGQRIGSGLLRDAILRALSIHRQIGFRGILVHALDDDATAFYAKYDFVPCAVDPRTMILPIETALRVYRQPAR
jgi:predicted N-acetyltransferase YhbS